jgi:nucleoside-diphosphate-sugar epimerase
MKTVLILGAQGRLGLAAARVFAESGWQVLAQVRRPPAQPMPDGVETVLADLRDTAALLRAASGASVVVHAVNPSYERWAVEALPRLRDGLALARALGATFMLPGNVYNFGRQLPPRIDALTSPQPDHAKARIRVAMEDEMRVAAESAAREGHALRCVVIRAGDFFGAGTGSWLDQAIVRDLRRGRLVYPGPLDRVHAWAYLPDLARVFERVASAPAAAPFEVLPFGGHATTGAQLLATIEAVATEWGLRPAHGFQRRGLPWAFIRWAGLVHAPWRELAEMAYLWQRPHAIDGAALAARVVLPASTPLPVALRQALSDLGFGPPPLAYPV